MLQRTRNTDFPRIDLGKPEIVVISEASREVMVDLEGLLDELGIELSLMPYRHDLAGTLTRHGDRWTIGVNRSHAESRRRFTIAHEIGHYVYHRDLVSRREGIRMVADGLDYRQPDIEGLHNPFIEASHDSTANVVAVNMLMNADKMRRVAAEGHDLAGIAARIGCTIETTRLRLKGLGIVAA